MGKAFFAALILVLLFVLALKYSSGFRAWLQIAPVTT
jgi:hypothetical protein